MNLQIHFIYLKVASTLLHTLLRSSFKDLEDGYQYGAAINCSADVLLTVNKKDFVSVANSGLLILTPKEYISRFG